jgi:hypothetical protein
MKTKTILFSLVLTLAFIATGCPSRTDISKIEGNPSKYLNKDVAIAGRVTNSFGIALIGGIYKVDDGTGSMWVATSRGVPSKGAQVGVKGRIQEGVSYGGKNYGLGMIEDERRVK